MNQVLELIFSVEFINSTIRLTTPILFATMAALISEQAGVVNIGIEGTMLFAALMGVVGSAFTGSALWGVVIAMAAGIAFSALLAFFHLRLDTNIVLTGISLNLLSSGLTIFILYLLTGDKGVSTSLPSKTVPDWNIPLVEDIPVLGDILSGHNILTYVAILLIVVITIFLKRTKLGKYIRAVGENPESVATAGISVNVIRTKALLISGAISGLGGAFMSMAYVSMFTKDMVAGRGFIALAAEAMGRGNPLLSALSALIFGLADALSNNLQTINLSSELLRLIPYCLTIVMLAIYAYRLQKSKKS